MNRKFIPLILGLLALPAAGQIELEIPLPVGTRGAAVSIAEDGDIALYCKYIGTSACASIAIDAGTGDATFTDGTCGAETATDTFECPVAAPLGGVIDVSNGSCNTIGEFVDIVNASTDWRCLPYAALRTDTTVDALVTIAATQATAPNGLGLAYDSSVFLSTTAVLAPATTQGYRFLSGTTGTGFTPNPWANSQAILTHVYGVSTYGAGTSVMAVYSVRRNFAATGSETVTTLYPAQAMGATTVAIDFGSCDTPATGCNPAWGAAGVWGLLGDQLLVRVTNSNALASNTLNASGTFGPRVGP